jgi:hypothetical protein
MSDSFHYERTTVAADVVLWQMFGPPDETRWERMLREAEAWLIEQEGRGRQWGMIIDPTEMTSVTANMRRAAGQWRARNMPLIANTCICAAYVATSPVWRGAITAVFWFAKPVVPVSVRANQEEAHQWVVTKMNDLSALSV